MVVLVTDKKKKTEIGKGSVSLSQFEAGSGSIPFDVMLGKGQILKIDVETGGGDQGIVTPPPDRKDNTENATKTSEKSHRRSLYQITPPKFGDDPDEKSSEKNAERKRRDSGTRLSSAKKTTILQLYLKKKLRNICLNHGIPKLKFRISGNIRGRRKLWGGQSLREIFPEILQKEEN